MTEYINKAMVLKILDAFKHKRLDDCIGCIDTDCMDCIRDFIATFKSDDVAPIKHSKWEISFDGYYPYCLNCKYEPDRDKLSDFCPSCGSRMDGGINEQ